MADCNIRNVDDKLMRAVKVRAAEAGLTMREWVVGVLERGVKDGVAVGFEGKHDRRVAGPLEEVAGESEESDGGEGSAGTQAGSAVGLAMRRQW
jgi:hypothetical protein